MWRFRTCHLVPIPPLDPARLQAFIGPDRVDRLRADGRTHSRGALRPAARQHPTRRLIGRRGPPRCCRRCSGTCAWTGLEAEWLVIEGEPAFFAITKRVHNGLYGGRGDGGALQTPSAGCASARRRRTSPACATPPAGDVASSCTTRSPPGSSRRCSRTAIASCGAAMSASTTRTRGRSARGVRTAVPSRRPCASSSHEALSRRAGWTNGASRSSRRRSTPPLKNHALDGETARGVLAAAGLIAGNGIAPTRGSRTLRGSCGGDVPPRPRPHSSSRSPAGTA